MHKSTWKLNDREVAHVALALSWMTETALKEMDGKVFGHEPMTEAEIHALANRFSAMFKHEKKQPQQA